MKSMDKKQIKQRIKEIKHICRKCRMKPCVEVCADTRINYHCIYFDEMMNLEKERESE